MGRLMVPALLGLAVYYAVFGGEYSVLDVHRIQSDTEEARANLTRLNAETDSLSLLVDALENDPQTLEMVARENFGMIRDGEVLYRFADEPVDTREGPE